MPERTQHSHDDSLRSNRLRRIGLAAVLTALAALCLPLVACSGGGGGEAERSAASAVAPAGDADARLAPYLAALDEHGRDPVDYVVELLRRHDLLLFDDGLHNAAEPFDFYRRLLAEPAFLDLVDVVFLEAVELNHQPALDAYLAADEDDPSLLYPAFQDDTGGLGFPYKTYFDLLRAVREANQGRPPEERLRVVAVSNPTYWCAVRTAADVASFRRGLLGRDYDMYKVILDEMGGFEAGRKGVFLTNTRHAYTGVERSEEAGGGLFWNTGTFFRQHHPGKTWSLRIHNVALFIEQEKAADEVVETTEGLGRYSYRWGRMEDGLWDSAFRARGDRPVALPLAGTPFGAAAYVGNHMLQAAPGQTMADAYDGLIFLAPLEDLHQCAKVGEIYTPQFLIEAARRYRILYTEDQIADQLEAEGVGSVEELLAPLAEGEPRQPSAASAGLEAVDAWRSER